jgi:hypothetical protein
MPALPIKGSARTLSSTSLNQIQARSLIFDVCRRSASLDVAVTWLDDDKVRLCKSRLDHVEYNIVFRLRVTDQRIQYSLRYIGRTDTGTLKRKTGYIKYSSPSVLTPTRYSTVGHNLSGVLVPGTCCNVINTAGAPLTIEGRHNDAITNDITKFANDHDHKKPRAVVVVGNTLVVAIENKYCVY